MRGSFRSALCAAVGALAIASAAHAAAPVLTNFDASSFAAPHSGAQLGRAIEFSQSSALPVLAYGPPDTSQVAVANLTTSIALSGAVELQLGYKVDLTGRTTTHANLDGLFLSSAVLDSPYDSLANGGDFVGATAALGSDLHLTFGGAKLSPGYTTYAPGATAALARLGGASNPFNERTATSLLGGVSWDVARWGTIGLTASQTSERGGVLGNAMSGLNANTSALGVAARVALGGGWVTTAVYSEAITQLNLKPGLSPSLASDSLRTRSYGLAIAKNGLFGDDALGLAVSRPAFGADSNEFITMTGGHGRQQFFTRNNLLEGTTPETDIEIGYVTTFLDGSVALQTNASYQMNFAGQTGANAVSLLSRARIKF